VRAAVRLGAAAGALLAIPAEQLRRDGAPPRAGVAPLSRQIQRGLTGDYPDFHYDPKPSPFRNVPSRPKRARQLRCCVRTGACRQGALYAVSCGVFFRPVHAWALGQALGRMSRRADSAGRMRRRQRQSLCLQASFPTALDLFHDMLQSLS
jgi:hypothetical protein